MMLLLRYLMQQFGCLSRMETFKINMKKYPENVSIEVEKVTLGAWPAGWVLLRPLLVIGWSVAGHVICAPVTYSTGWPGCHRN